MNTRRRSRFRLYDADGNKLLEYWTPNYPKPNEVIKAMLQFDFIREYAESEGG